MILASYAMFSSKISHFGFTAIYAVYSFVLFWFFLSPYLLNLTGLKAKKERLMNDVSLYSITSEFKNLMETLEENGGEMTAENEVLLAELQTQLVTKTDNVVEWVQSQEDLMLLADNKIKLLQEFKKGIGKRLDKFDTYANACLHTLGKMKIEGLTCAIKKRKPSKVVMISDESLIPMEFIKIPEPKAEIMKAEIGKALKAGQEVPGASLEDSLNISISYGLK